MLAIRPEPVRRKSLNSQRYAGAPDEHPQQSPPDAARSRADGPRRRGIRPFQCGNRSFRPNPCRAKSRLPHAERSKSCAASATRRLPSPPNSATGSVCPPLEHVQQKCERFCASNMRQNKDLTRLSHRVARRHRPGRSPAARRTAKSVWDHTVEGADAADGPPWATLRAGPNG
jgi:hypothetical protein